MKSKLTHAYPRQNQGQVIFKESMKKCEVSDTVIGTIFDIQRFSIHDGPGIRTTVFLKGCPLCCQWCHNPEGIDTKPVLFFAPEKCIGCGYCFRRCKQEAHRFVEGKKHLLDRSRCKVCGACAEECFSGALELIGREVTVHKVITEVIRDKPFYETSGGGMTLSGGEPLMQIDFTEALLGAAKDEGLNCCLDTSGFADFSCFERILPFVDLFLYDIKDMNNERHIEFTGVSNIPIINNLKNLHRLGASILLRLPLIPGCNDRQDHFRSLAEIVKSLPNLCGVEVIPYHGLHRSKRGRLGLKQVEEVRVPDRAMIADWVASLDRLGVKVINQMSPSS